LFTRHGQGSKTTIEGDAKVVAVDYSNKESIKSALTGVDVVICTISIPALNLQAGIAAAAKEAGVKLFVPSEFGNISAGETVGMFGEKADIQNQLKAVGIPCTAFYTGPFADYLWAPYVFTPRRFGASVELNIYLYARLLDLDVLSGKVTIAGDGNKQISFTSRADIARYVSFVLTHMPAERLKNQSFTIAGDNKVRRPIILSLAASDHGGRRTVVQRDLQGIRGENREKSGSHLRPDFRIRRANSCRCERPPRPPAKVLRDVGPFPENRPRSVSRLEPLPGARPRTSCLNTQRQIRSQNVLYDHCCKRHQRKTRETF
jgi:hypothetical protein